MYVILALAMLSALVVAHELGHFLAARACGIPVREFSVGMGPLLLSRKGKGGTQFSLRALPVGGYCMFYGESEDGAPKRDEHERAFAQEPLRSRLLTIVSGPLMNFLVALVVVVLFVSALGVQTVVPRVDEVEENARAAGLLSGDELVAVDGKAVTSTDDVVAAINAAGGAPVTLTVLRGGQEMELPIAPFYDGEAGRYRVGFSFAVERTRIPLWQSVPFSVRYCVDCVGAIVDALAGIFSRGEGVEDVTGIVGTVYVIQDATRSGGVDMFLELLAMISVNLGVMNLLPVPGLDGSKLLFLLAEGVRGKPVSQRLEGALTMAGMALLFTLMIVLTYKDVAQILLGGF